MKFISSKHSLKEILENVLQAEKKLNPDGKSEVWEEMKK